VEVCYGFFILKHLFQDEKLVTRALIAEKQKGADSSLFYAYQLLRPGDGESR
jgi:hypothetical protein